MSLDLAELRRQTPGVEYGIHLNNAGAALMPSPVVDAVVEHLRLESRIGGYEAAEQEHERLEAVYASLARLLKCQVSEIALVDNATRAWDMVFYALPLGEGQKVLTTVAEYASNYIAFLQQARRRGFAIEVVPNDEHGQVDLEQLACRLDETVALVAVSHVPTNGGLVQPAAAIGKLTREASVPYLLDACQSVGQLPVSVAEIGCDFLSGTSRKYLRGPRGVGFLYVAEPWIEKLDPPFLDLHSAVWVAPDRYEVRRDARRFETWESDLAGRLGLGVAVDYLLELGEEQTWERLRLLAQRFRQKLSGLAEVQVADLGEVQGGIVTFKVEGVAPEVIKKEFFQRGIHVSTVTERAARLDMEARGLDELVRASVHYYNTEPECDQAVEALSEIIFRHTS